MREIQFHRRVERERQTGRHDFLGDVHMFWSAAETNVHNLSFCLFKVFYLVGLQEGGSSESEESWEVRSR